MMGDPGAARKYRPIVELGRGGMAEVFLAVAQGHAGFNRLVVIKKTRIELSGDPEFITMFLDEARLAARLTHPNIVQTYEVGEDGHQHFIAMEYLEGQPMNRVRKPGPAASPLPFALHLRVLAEVLAGLHYAHELADFDGTPLGVVHRDVTPQNVFVTYEGHVKLVDFGIAKAAGASVETRHGMIKGKVAYMPPEQAASRPVDRRADVFAVGVMLWEAITGARMWKDVPEIVVIHHLSKGEIPRVRDVKTSGVAPALERIVERALAVRPEERFATAAEMQAELESYLDGLGEKSSPREMGRYMIERFRDQRAAVKQLIEAQVSDVRWSGPVSSSKLPDLPRLSSPSELGPADAGQDAIAVEGAPSLRFPSQPPSTLAGADVSAVPRIVGAEAPVDPRIVTLQSAAPEPAQRKPAPRKSRSPAAIGGAVILSVLAAGVGGYKIASRAPPAAANAAIPGTASAAVSGVPERELAGVASAAAPARRATCPDGMVLIPGGRFFMGSDQPTFDLWKPAHRVTLDTFCIDVYEVTSAGYKACSDAGNCKRPDPVPSYPKAAGELDAQHDKDLAAYAELCNFGKEGREKHPINCVSWELADNYCKVQKGRLPTEAEWEFAARGSDGRKYPWGDEPGDAEHMNACGTECNAWEAKHGVKPSARMYDADDGFPGTAPVGSFPKGKTTTGAYDFIGNVWEWTSDWFEIYKPGDAINPTGAPAGNRKAIRGGGFNGGAKLWLDPAFRYHQIPTASAPAIGFRCAASL